MTRLLFVEKGLLRNPSEHVFERNYVTDSATIELTPNKTLTDDRISTTQPSCSPSPAASMVSRATLGGPEMLRHLRSFPRPQHSFVVLGLAPHELISGADPPQLDLSIVRHSGTNRHLDTLDV